MTALHPARPKTTLRRLLLGMLVIALSALGLAAATPASAATKTLTGIGPGEASVSLAKGIYDVTLTYSGNANGEDPALFGALLNSDNDTVLELLAVDQRTEHSTHKLVQIFLKTKVTFQVMDAASDAAWTVTFESVGTDGAPAMPTPVSGVGLNSSPFYRLKAGAYQMTTTFAGNVRPEGETEWKFSLALYDVNGDDHALTSGSKTSGTATTSFRVPRTSVYWFHPQIASTDATWSVQITALKQFTSTPTPKISGTAKVGKTLKAKAGTWKPSGAKFSYQWYRGSSKISGATKSSYKLTSKDKGKKITVTVTGSKSGYLSVAKTSKTTGSVKK